MGDISFRWRADRDKCVRVPKDPTLIFINAAGRHSCLSLNWMKTIFLRRPTRKHALYIGALFAMVIAIYLLVLLPG